MPANPPSTVRMKTLPTVALRDSRIPRACAQATLLYLSSAGPSSSPSYSGRGCAHFYFALFTFAVKSTLVELEGDPESCGFGGLESILVLDHPVSTEQIVINLSAVTNRQYSTYTIGTNESCAMVDLVLSTFVFPSRTSDIAS